MRYDTASRSWVPLTTPTVRPATIAPQNLAPENNSATAKVITAPTPVEPDASASGEPGFLDRIGRAATSPLRAIGIGND